MVPWGWGEGQKKIVILSLIYYEKIFLFKHRAELQ
jgi:hypothetical protein